ncbi:hypothetical protein LTR66_015306, partial [Elasticomyces elasticus]
TGTRGGSTTRPKTRTRCSIRCFGAGSTTCWPSGRRRRSGSGRLWRGSRGMLGLGLLEICGTAPREVVVLLLLLLLEVERWRVLRSACGGFVKGSRRCCAIGSLRGIGRRSRWSRRYISFGKKGLWR